MEFFRRCWGFAIPLLLIIVAIPILVLMGASDRIILLVSQGGTALVIFVTFAYIVFFDSKKRWPNTSWVTRHYRLLTFQR